MFDFSDDEEIQDEDLDEDIGDDFDNSLYLKYMFEGIVELEGLAAALRALAEELSTQATEGWTLSVPVDGGWVHLVPPTAETAG